MRHEKQTKNARCKTHIEISQNANTVFIWNMMEKSVGLELFIIQGKFFFRKGIKAKNIRSHQVGLKLVKLHVFTKNAAGDLQDTWDEVKALIVQYCAVRDLKFIV